MNVKKTKLVFVGTGTMGQCAHLKNYVTWPDECEVVALAEVRPELAKKVAARYGIKRVYNDHRELLEKEEFDGIVASQPFDRHGILIRDLVKIGKPIFTEKPIAASIAVGEEIVALEERYGVKHMVGYHKRCDPAIIYAKEAIDRLVKSNELGAMKYVRLLMPEGDWIASGFSDFIGSKETASGGFEVDPPAADMDGEVAERYIAFVNYYIHQVNLMRHLLGEDYRPVYADPSGILLAGRSDSGVACTIEMSPYKTSIDWQEQAFVCFKRGWIRVDLPAPLANNRPGRVTIHREPEGGPYETVQPDLPWVHAMRQQALTFAKFCRGEANAPCGATEALKDLRIAREYIRLRYGK